MIRKTVSLSENLVDLVEQYRSFFRDENGLTISFSAALVSLAQYGFFSWSRGATGERSGSSIEPD